MFNLSSPQDQVSNFIVNKAYFGKSYRSNLDQNRTVMATILNITPSLKAVLT